MKERTTTAKTSPPPPPVVPTVTVVHHADGKESNKAKFVVKRQYWIAPGPNADKRLALEKVVATRFPTLEEAAAAAEAMDAGTWTGRQRAARPKMTDEERKAKYREHNIKARERRKAVLAELDALLKAQAEAK
jgi:hypothetical protein